VVVVSALSGVTDALEAAVAGAAAGRLGVAGFVGALGARHTALLESVANGRPAARAATALRAQLAELSSRLASIAAAGGPTPADRAAVLAAGERLSAPVFAAGLATLGLDARAIDAAEIVRTDAAFAEAGVDLASTRALSRRALAELGPAAVPVVTGFIGATQTGETTLLGRGASDLTAAILGWALDSERVEIWSDVPGVLDADPRLVPTAATIPWLSYAAATALARRGAKVLHPRTLEPLEDAGIPVYVGHTLRPDGPGTWIAAEPAEVAVTSAEEDGTAA
jgi:aspartate kinase